VKVQATQKDAGEEEISKARVHPSTKVQPSAMEIDMNALGSVEVKRHAIIMDKATLLDKGIRIPNLNRFMWIQTKQNYDKHVKRLENWKDISEKEEWAFKARLVTLFMMNWEAPMPNIMLEFLNTFVIKSTNIYFGYQDKVYVISKQLIVSVLESVQKGM